VAQNVVIRAYEPRDREAARKICCDTAFQGEPVEKFFTDREVFADALMNYYLDFEPESSFVAEVNGKVVGYVTACCDSKRYRRTFALRILPLLLLKSLARGVFWKRGTRRFAWAMVRGVLSGAVRAPKLRRMYPAHLHINFSREFRGEGFGKQLMERALEHLRDAGASGVHIVTVKENDGAVRFFRAMRFQPLEFLPAPYWEETVNEHKTALVMARSL
jgi:ribosomal protein S18 acetylase RimI-like enzyme